MDDIIKDDRFKHIANDSRFKIMPKNERKFKVDKRFKNMFEDQKFKLKYTVDKRGRPINMTSNDNLKKFYQLSSSESEAEGDEKDEENKKDDKLVKVEKKKDKTEPEIESESESEPEKDEEEKSEEESEDESEEESEDEDDESEPEKEAEAIPWHELDGDTKREDKTSSRLALCNMDWDRIKAVDIFVLLNSFKPAQGVLKSIKIFLSDYGKKRLEYERLHGPQELTENGVIREENDEDENLFSDEEEDEDNENKNRYQNDDDDEEGRKFDRRKLRIYQFNRLRYFYAVVECDTAETADKIYTECDGMEYESSSTRLDLRFVPEDTVFDENELRDSCTEAPDPITYKPNLFVTTALNQTKVECTWDETPRDRLAITMKKYTEDDLKNSDFKNYLATSSEEEDEENERNNKCSSNTFKIKSADKVKPKINKDESDKQDESDDNNEVKDEEEDRIKKYRQLLLGAETKTKKERDCDLEFSWEGGIEEEGFNELLFNSDNKEDSKKTKKKFEKKPELTEEEKNDQARLSMLTMDDDDAKAHFNLDDLLLDKKQGKKSRKFKKGDNDEDEKKPVDDFHLDVKDPRFQAIFSDHKFNIDPSDQLFKKTKAMETLMEEKINRIKTDDLKPKTDEDKQEAEKTERSSVSLLVKSIKSKTESLKRKKEDLEISKELKKNKINKLKNQ